MELTLLRDYQGQPVNGWLMSEKLDGWRVLWTGTEFVSREGHTLEAPEWFKAGMPTVALDGELFAGRGQFNRIQTLIASGWHGLEFRPFDLPEHPGTFRQRYAKLQKMELPGHVHHVAHFFCNDTRHLLEFADNIVDGGGEGAVVRNPRARYVGGRTHDVLRWVPQDPRKNRAS